MKVGIDTFACKPGVSGVGVYLSQILKRIPASGIQYELFGWDYDRYAFSETAKNMTFVPRGRIRGETANQIWHILKYPAFALSSKFDVCFFPAAHRRLPRTSPCPAVGTVHDMAAYWGTRKTREHLGAVLRPMLPNALRRLDRIIAVSGWIKQELIDLIGVHPQAIEVVPNGVDMGAFYPREINDGDTLLIEPFGFKRPYILYAARLEHPVKNHIRLVKAFEIFKSRTKFPHRLVFAGSNSRGADKIKEAVATSANRGDIFITGTFPSKSLPELYSGADFVVIPSLYEGFGQSALEAMACAVPAICAKAASLPETAENAALYFEPEDCEDMADRMVRLASDRELHSRLRAAGLERAKSFSWDVCAERTLKIILEAAGV
ncbi:MAG: glycosyltransferase family 4 protein [Spirochaetaceae bacterium]|jgi:glycosyltransferase involved in cell wall biosynthesis|nr:glycosyltransferase family 4 protein [Spirochaetaceae bacterium]